MKFRELGRVKQIIEESTGLDISHFYDDLIFVENLPFIIKFDDTDMKKFIVYFNKECPVDARQKLFTRLQDSSAKNEMFCEWKGSFEMRQQEGSEELNIDFYEHC